VATHISFRDVQFSNQVDAVAIAVYTDIPCHLYCRLTKEQPQIHTKSVSRRGTSFMSELRFCFVSYEDNEQAEPGDTVVHTWVKPDWGYCITKWVYFWGYVAGEVSQSTSPFFKYHNDMLLPWPTMHQVVLEPWTFDGPTPPVFIQLVYEPWTYETPPWTQLFYEPWTS
jgi:hypothetical protein